MMVMVVVMLMVRIAAAFAAAAVAAVVLDCFLLRTLHIVRLVTLVIGQRTAAVDAILLAQQQQPILGRQTEILVGLLAGLRPCLLAQMLRQLADGRLG
uniref:Putative secreted protein n=1 Tax=Anopheles darlingi TaxID=43151 RepID=A0A2M4D6Y6_ANODA